MVVPDYAKHLAAAVHQLKELVLDESDVVVDVPVSFAGFDTKLYVRGAYVALWNYLHQRKAADPHYQGAVVSGNPAIGKSCFAFYCMLR